MNLEDFSIEQAIAIVAGIGIIFLALLYFAIKNAVKITVNKSISKIFEKEIEKYKTELLYASQIHNFAVERQMQAFDQCNKYLAKLVPIIQDMAQAIENYEFSKYQKRCFIKYLKLIPKMKQSILEFEPYIDMEIYQSFTAIISYMQKTAGIWHELFTQLSHGLSIEKNETIKAHELCDELLMKVACARVTMIKYLKNSSNLKMVSN